MFLQPIIILHLKCCSLQGKSQIVQEELVKLGGQMVSTSEGTRALGLELCREFEEKFLQHLTGGEVSIFYFFIFAWSSNYLCRETVYFI